MSQSISSQARAPFPSAEAGNSSAQCLSAIFIAVRATVGDARFAFLLEQFAVHAATPRSAPQTKHNFPKGAGAEELQTAYAFSRFLLSHNIRKDFPALADLATFELEIVRAVRTPGVACLGAERWELALDIGETHHVLQAYVATLGFAAPVHSLWQQALGGPRVGAWQPEWVLISQLGRQLQVVRLGEAQYRFLKRLRRGLDWQTAAAGLTNFTTAQIWLRDWTALGCFCARDALSGRASS